MWRDLRPLLQPLRTQKSPATISAMLSPNSGADGTQAPRKPRPGTRLGCARGRVGSRLLRHCSRGASHPGLRCLWQSCAAGTRGSRLHLRPLRLPPRAQHEHSPFPWQRASALCREAAQVCAGELMRLRTVPAWVWARDFAIRGQLPTLVDARSRKQLGSCVPAQRTQPGLRVLLISPLSCSSFALRTAAHPRDTRGPT